MDRFLNRLRGLAPRTERGAKNEDAVTTQKYLHNLGFTLEQLRGKKVLDVGAGSGAFVRSAIKAGASAVALDNNRSLRTDEAGTPFESADAAAMPFADESFDFVFSNNALPMMSIYGHTPSDEEALEEHGRRERQVGEMLRVLKPGGEVRFDAKRNEDPDIYRRNASMESLIQSLKARPDLEVIEEFLGRDQGHDPQGTLHSADSYRIIVRKQSGTAS